MSTAAFHFNVDNRLHYTCRLVRKAVAAGNRLVVTGSDDTLAQLDRDLWALSATEFLPHCHGADPAPLARRSPVLLCESLDGVAVRDVLINLAELVPQGAQGFERVIEVVTVDPLERSLARLRWKHYSQAGVKLVQHDLGHRTAP
ncbi:DNA polymerase III subunit chi [Rhodoferax sp. BLA1]|uniref:DNA polymerase III subunit chi n=1 Tax=Rhodoferax sp. BLA1 TaxID=2576062 RepID=UPI0015D3FF87